MSAALVVLLAAATPALPIELRPAIQSQISPGELQNLRNREMRRAFQDQQQLLRELDRQRLAVPQQRLDVPVMRGTCRVQVFGNKFVRNCR